MQRPHGRSVPVVSTRAPCQHFRVGASNPVHHLHPGPCPADSRALRPFGHTVSETRRRCADITEDAYTHLDGQPTPRPGGGHLLLPDDSPAQHGTVLSAAGRSVPHRDGAAKMCHGRRNGHLVPSGGSGRHEAGTGPCKSADFMHAAPQASPCFRPHSQKENAEAGPC